MEHHTSVMKEDGEVRIDTFGEWLNQQRSLRRLTRVEFAKRVGCSVSALRKIEYGERRPSTQIAQLMSNCLDVPPEERSTFVRVARGELNVDRLQPESKPVATTNISSLKTNLPIVPTPLIGREREVEQLSQLLRDPQCRLLTLVGPGGIGKTRLAIETASTLQDVFPDGVYFIPLASANSTRFIVPVIADAIGFAFHSASHADPKIQLYGYLKEKQVLLLLDNLEQLLTEPGIQVFAELLAYAPQVKLLCTSRESLGLQDEWVFEVQGLPVPQSTYVEGSAQNTSMELFLQRARRAHVGFNATPEDYPAIIRICQLMEGNPLGIELAAAWVRTLSCTDIVLEIERGLDFLTVSARDIPARHRSMRAVFDHSWKLLTEEEQQVLLRLSVFRGGFRREAAEAVAGATLSTLSTLVTKSLVRRSGAGRYDLHELIRQFAAEQFAARTDEQTATQACHGRYYLTYFGQADGRLRSFAQRDVLTELTADMDNFRTAWDWAVTHGRFPLIEYTLRMFWMLYDVRGWLQEGIDYLDRALEPLERAVQKSPLSRADQITLAHILICQSLLSLRLARNERARIMLVRSIEILQPLNEPRVLVEAVSFLGIVMAYMGDYSGSLKCFNEGLAIATITGDHWFAALCQTEQAIVVSVAETMRGNIENGYERLRSALSAWRATGDPRFTAFTLNFLSLSATRLGRIAEARSALEESIKINLSIGDRWGLGTAYRGLGLIAQEQHDHKRAIESLQISRDTLSDLGARLDVARVLGEMGKSFHALGNENQAERNWRESLSIATQTQGTPVVLEALTGLAGLHAKRGNAEDALQLLLIILNNPASSQETKNSASDLRTNLEAQLTPTQIGAIQAQAGEKTLEAVVEDLLK